MTSVSALEVEELENIPLVRMEDVQPDRTVVYVLKSQYDKDHDCDSYQECIDDDSSNIGSMVSIQSEEVMEEDAEIIVPEELEPEATAEEKPSSPSGEEPKLLKPSWPDSWPTLEILPGGVINLADKPDPNLDSLLFDQEPNERDEMMYACAKCSQSFEFLVCLVKHVRWHEIEARRMKMQALTKFSPVDKKMANLKQRCKVVDDMFQSRKRVAETAKSKDKTQVKHKDINLQSSCKRKVVAKPKVRRVPKKS